MIKAEKEIPHQKKVAHDIDPMVLLENAAAVLGADLKRFKEAAKVSPQEVQDRDLLIYLLWQRGHQTHQQIGGMFGLTYSAVSRRISIFRNLIQKDKELGKKLNHVKSRIKIWRLRVFSSLSIASTCSKSDI